MIGTMVVTRRIVGFFRKALSNGIPRRAATVAAVVAPILILINQGDALFGDASFHLGKAMLTAVVPYLVATAGAVSALSGESTEGAALPASSRDALDRARQAAMTLKQSADSEQQKRLAGSVLASLEELDKAIAPSAS